MVFGPSLFFPTREQRQSIYGISDLKAHMLTFRGGDQELGVCGTKLDAPYRSWMKSRQVGQARASSDVAEVHHSDAAGAGSCSKYKRLKQISHRSNAKHQFAAWVVIL